MQEELSVTNVVHPLLLVQGAIVVAVVVAITEEEAVVDIVAIEEEEVVIMRVAVEAIEVAIMRVAMEEIEVVTMRVVTEGFLMVLIRLEVGLEMAVMDKFLQPLLLNLMVVDLRDIILLQILMVETLIMVQRLFLRQRATLVGLHHILHHIAALQVIMVVML